MRTAFTRLALHTVRPSLARRSRRPSSFASFAAMASSPSFTLVPGVPEADGSTPVFVGSKAALSVVAALAGKLYPACLPLWSSLVDAAAAVSADAGGTACTYLPASSEGGAATKLCVAVLPSACSRHNAPAQPHAVTSLVAGLLSAGVTTVYAVAPASHALATACALARTVPAFSAKTPKPGAPPSPPKALRCALITEAAAPAVGAEALAALQAAADGVRLAARLVDTPPEEMTTTAMRAEAKAVAAALGPSVVYSEIVGPELRDRGFGGLWGVGKAALCPPALVHLSYTPPAPDGQPPVALVGKGIVYDTGGLALKTAAGMCGMKCDMGGSAACLAAFQAAVTSGCTRPLHLLLCLAENAIGPGAVRNDDILTLYSGRTVEINNTDAEGRLVLGDGVAYATKHLAPGLVIDMATLTGAQLVATGLRHAAVVSKCEAWEAAAVQAGAYSGDLAHPLPYAPEFFRSEFASKVADMKNSVKDRMNASSSCAAIFVAEHLAPEYEGAWLHVDIAGPAWAGERGTGYGVALLLALLPIPALQR